jgi:cyclopropane fatty-acyl-phospholipid synthase-like methyltransferase
MRIIEKSWNEFWAYYWRVTQRKTIPDIEDYDRKVVSLVETRCRLKPPMRILDLGCGGGEQSIGLAKLGYEVVGIDIAEPLTEHANTLASSTRTKATFIASDMRLIDYKNEFHACLLLSGTFGFFTEAENQDLVRRIHQALLPGGSVLIMYISAHRSDMNRRTWKEIEGGYQLTESWFEPESSTYHTTARLIMDSGEVIIPAQEEGYHANECIRCYTPPEISNILTEAGFTNVVHLGSKHLDHPNAALEPREIREIVVAQKP